MEEEGNEFSTAEILRRMKEHRWVDEELIQEWKEQELAEYGEEDQN